MRGLRTENGGGRVGYENENKHPVVQEGIYTGGIGFEGECIRCGPTPEIQINDLQFQLSPL